MRNKIKCPVRLHDKLLELVCENGTIEAGEVRKFIKDNYSFNDNTVTAAYRKLCNSVFIEVSTVDNVKYLSFERV